MSKVGICFYPNFWNEIIKVGYDYYIMKQSFHDITPIKRRLSATSRWA